MRKRLTSSWQKRLLFAMSLSVMAMRLDAGSIQAEITGLQGNSYRYEYVFTNFVLQPYQEIEIRFLPEIYTNLRNAQAGAEFTVALAEPGNPPGAAGFYSILTQVNHPLFAGTFSVEFDYLGSGLPGQQAFAVNQFTSDRIFVQTLETGVTAVPEPSSRLLMAIVLCAGLCWVRLR